MDEDKSTNSQLLADIDLLRAKALKTPELYREVCALMFFRYGMTPTANRLYQLVKKGSMSAPSEALATFWTDLRAKSRVRVAHPDLPESLQESAGSLLAQLWDEAQQRAGDSLEVLRSEASSAIRHADLTVKENNLQREKLGAQLHQAASELRESREDIALLKSEITAANATATALREEITRVNAQSYQYLTQLNVARREFAEELSKLRDDKERDRGYLLDAQKHANMEVDRARLAVKKIEKLLDDTNEKLERAGAEHEQERSKLYGQVEKLQHEVWEANSARKIAAAQNVALTTNLASVKDTLAQLQRVRSTVGSPSARIATTRGGPRATPSKRTTLRKKPAR